ncbi:MAG: hypothetical protein R3212_14245, partial [Xanthomonadales bacterium]|nr:hypothetical protein [Xanthomonadales bacterium]
YTIGSPSSGSATLDDDPAVVTLDVIEPVAIEGSGIPGEIQLGRSGGNIGTPLRIYFTIDGTATRNVDYTLSPSPFGAGGNLFFLDMAANNTSLSIHVTALLDEEEEMDESAEFQLAPWQSPAHEYNIGVPAQGTVTIINLDLIFRGGFETQ